MELTKEELMALIRDLANELNVPMNVSMQDRKSVLVDRLDELNKLKIEPKETVLVQQEELVEEVIDPPKDPEVVVEPVGEPVIEVIPESEDFVDIIFNQDTTLYKGMVAHTHKKGSRLRLVKSEYKALRYRFALSGKVPFDTVKALLMRNKRERDRDTTKSVNRNK